MSAVELPSPVRKAIDEWVVKFPEEHRQSALLYALRVSQEHFGWLSPAVMDAVAAYLGVPHIAVYEVATFYTMYDTEPKGRTKIGICRSISCYLCGSDALAKHVEQKLGLKCGESNEAFTLEGVECLAACAGAPALIVNNKEYHEKMTPEAFDALIERLKA